MVYKLARILVLFVLWSPLAAHALGLGEIDTHSALNQPLQAEIELLAARPDEVDSIGVKLASNATFEQAGVERISMLSELRFKVEQKPNGNHYIRVYTQELIKEPFLNFLIEVNWSAGRLVREYTVLLDPPVLMSARQPRIQAPTAKTTPAPQTATSTAQRIPEVAPPSPVASETTTAPTPRDNNAALVRRNDTLWSVAQRLRPNTAVSPQQMMLALLKANPEAFIDNNVNNLKAGHRLHVPDSSEINLISQDDALREIKRQNALWASAKAKPTVAARTEERDDTGTTHLKLVAPSEIKSSANSSGSAAQGTSASIDNLQKDIAVANEALESRRQENEELRSRLADLEKQVESMQRLITLKDENLASLQNKLSAPAPDAVATAPTPQEPAPQPTTQPAAPPAQPVTPAPAPVAKSAATPSPAPLQGLWNNLQSNPVTQAIVGGAALLLIALLWIINRRRQMNAATLTETDFYSMDLPPGDPATEAVDQAAIETPEPAHTVTSDQLAEVDVYLAYEQYPQAEALLRQLIAKDPHRHELELRLLELFYLTKNKNAFGAQAENLHAALEGQPSLLWDKAVFMGKQFYPEHPLFAAAAVEDETFRHGEPAATVSSPEMDFTLDIPAAEEKQAPITFDFDIAPPSQSEAAAIKSGSSDIDFSLATFEQEMESLTKAPATPEPVAKELPALDFAVDNLTLVSPSTPAVKREPDISFDFDMEKEAEALADSNMATLEYESEEEDTAPFAVGSEISTKLDLARAYIDMGDDDGARSILDEVVDEGDETQKNEARELMRQLRS